MKLNITTKYNFGDKFYRYLDDRNKVIALSIIGIEIRLNKNKTPEVHYYARNNRYSWTEWFPESAVSEGSIYTDANKCKQNAIEEITSNISRTEEIRTELLGRHGN